MRWFRGICSRTREMRLYLLIAAAITVLYMLYSWMRLSDTHMHNGIHEEKFVRDRERLMKNHETSSSRKENLRYHQHQHDKTFRRGFDVIGKRPVTHPVQVRNRPTLDSFDLYEKANYSYSDGVNYVVNYPNVSSERFKKKLPLEVIFIKHTHIDPGWTSTADEFYEDRVQYILNNMLEYLPKYTDMKMILAETVYISEWWEKLNSRDKLKVSKVLENGRLEIVTGGWVMPDEACTHYAAIIDQLIEGHQWLLHNLKVKPKHNWSIDPFGHSATATYLWKLAGFNMMVVQRIHNAIKNYLLAKQNLQFNWRQRWDKKGSHDMLVYTDPWTYYMSSTSCGPEESVCRFFDLTNNHVLPGALETTAGLKSYANMLYDQLTRKASLYKQNVILVMLGNDFDGISPHLWTAQHVSFSKLFRYLNTNPAYNINARFGTLNDFAETFVRHSKNLPRHGLAEFQGDFFPYSVHKREQWTGYFTTKPNSKRLSRDLQENLRASSILNAFTDASISTKQVDGNSLLLQKARRELALFQHHDAITGTSKQRVSDDYDQRMIAALNHTRYATYRAVSSWLSIRYASSQFPNDLTFPDQTVIPPVPVFMKQSHKCIVLFNPLGRTQTSLVSVMNVGKRITVTNEKNEIMSTQNLPISSFTTRTGTHRHIMFKSVLQPLGLTVFKLDDKLGDNTMSHDTTLQKVSDTTKVVQLKNKCYEINFDQVSGRVTYIRLIKHNMTYKVNIDFQLYQSDSSSGLYLFKLREPVRYDETHKTTKFDGHLMSSITTRNAYLTHRISLMHSDDPNECGAIRIDNIAFLKKFKNRELIMTIRTDVRSADTFFVDSNGFQIVERRRIKQLKDVFYPMTNMMYIEDNSVRVTVHSRQALAASSLKSGDLNVLLDRNVATDDDKGAGEGVTDNLPAHSTFLLDIEPKLSATVGENTNPDGYNDIPLPSLRAVDINDRLQTPIVPVSFSECDTIKPFHPLKKSLPCDLKIVNIRELYPQSGLREYGVTIHRWAYNSAQFSKPRDCLIRNDISLCDFFPICPKIATEMSLSFIHEYSSVNPHLSLAIKPMAIRSYKVSW